MKELREIIRFWEKRKDQPLALSTLVRARGSSYRRPGARMLISRDGASAGSLSAGCIEEEVIASARDVIRDGKPQLVSFDTRRRFGCSGCIEIFVEPVVNDLLRELRVTLAARQSFQITTVFEDSDVLGSRIGGGAKKNTRLWKRSCPRCDSSSSEQGQMRSRCVPMQPCSGGKLSRSRRSRNCAIRRMRGPPQ